MLRISFHSALNAANNFIRAHGFGVPIHLDQFDDLVFFGMHVRHHLLDTRLYCILGAIGAVVGGTVVEELQKKQVLLTEEVWVENGIPL